MAGNYPDVPAPKMQFDRDGSIGFFLNASNVTSQLSSTAVRNLQDENNSTVVSYGSAGSPSLRYFGYIFPELRSIAGYFAASDLTGGSGNSSPGALQTSTNTTNGLDGTWVTAVSPWINSTLTIPNYRTAIRPLAITGVRAIRFGISGIYTGSMYTIHVYGDIESGQNPDRLRLWNPTLDQEVLPAHFDWGDTPRSTTDTKTFRIKNNSATLTANNIVVSLDTLFDASPSLLPQILYSYEGSAYAATVTVPALSPGATSSVITVQRSFNATTALGLWTQRVNAIATSWS